MCFDENIYFCKNIESKKTKEMQKLFVSICLLVSMNTSLCAQTVDGALQNLNRAIMMADSVFSRVYNTTTKEMSMWYDLDKKSKSGLVSVWEYTTGLEACCSVLEGLETLKDVAPDVYSANHDRFVSRLDNVYEGLDAYAGTYALTSYTGTNTWTVYSVRRGANPSEEENRMAVYDDQMWIIREMLRAYKLTGEQKFLTKAESLTSYVLDGWDCVRDRNGEEYGGITWGPGYTSKHACSNSPIVAPLVWLYEIYSREENLNSKARYYAFDTDGKRVRNVVPKNEYYLDFAKKVYKWQMDHLYDSSLGVFYDGAWPSSGGITYTEVDGVKCRNHLDVGKPQGTFWTYNTGTMVSGAAELYRVTGDEAYKTDLTKLVDRAYRYFYGAKRIDGVTYREMPYKDNNGKGGSPWFNDVMLRGFIDAAPYEATAKTAANYTQQALDYAFENHRRLGMLPIRLLDGWGFEFTDGGTQYTDLTRLNVMYPLSRVSEFGMLVKYASESTGIEKPAVQKKKAEKVNVYSVDGRLLKTGSQRETALQGLSAGLYIIDGQKIAVK